MNDFYSTQAFEDAFVYHGNDLGAIWTKERTIFRIWAPTASAVSIRLYASGDPNANDFVQALPMRYDFRGTWVAEKSGDLSGVYYTCQVQVEGRTVETCDPYAKAAGVNGRRAMVVDLEATNPPGWEEDRDPHAGAPITDAVIYELHVRDLSMDRSSGIRSKGKYLGLTEENTAFHGIPTGLAHMKALGITHLHLLPVFDFGYTDESAAAPRYNWGYDPENYNLPEGSYATDAFHGAVRIRELKQAIHTLHKNGISVVMDVVYNHVYHTFDYCFNQIVPGYFSRISDRGDISNGSCCGNDTASERAMVRKFLVDSVCYWAREYHIDGFRFDLVGLIDVATVQQIISAVHKDHPNVIFYGEGWQMNTSLTKPQCAMTVQGNARLVPRFSFFNDSIRDLIQGSVFDSTAPGFAAGGLCSREQLDTCFMGMPYWAQSPGQSINYLSCHDNATLFDRITQSAPQETEEIRSRMNRLAGAFNILSQGVPFFQAGEELLRSKPIRGGKFDHNSYHSPDSVNAIKWKALEKPECRLTADYYKGLIAFRKAHGVLRLQTKEEVFSRVHPLPCPDPHCAAYLLEGDEEQLFIGFNAAAYPVTLTLPEGSWKVCIQDNTAGTQTLAAVSGSVTLAPVSALGAVQSKIRPVNVVAALIWEKDKFLICQRPAHKARGLLWEFVGGKTEPGETQEQALIRECREELNITVDVGPLFMEVIHEYPDILIRLSLFNCTIPEGYPEALEHNDIRWIHPSQIDSFEFCPADEDILREIKRLHGSKPPL